MKKILERDSNTISIATFWENYQLDKYDFDPEYQRLSVWSEEKQSFLIDSILKNFPIPPIFLHQKIDDSTGKITFDVIDGKQRLTAIVSFIENIIPVSSELDGGVLDDKDLAGAYFEDLEKENLSGYKSHFWRYQIPVEYVDTTHVEVIDNVFDRLNRNGEPLNGQELRNSRYNKTALMQTVNRLSESNYWSNNLQHLDLSRMEDKEFISELLFSIETGGSIDSRPAIIDNLYEKYSTDEGVDWNAEENRFLAITTYMESLNINYEAYRIKGVSHLYGIWCLSMFCSEQEIDPDEVSGKLLLFYTGLRDKLEEENTQMYIKTMSSATKSKLQRTRRLQALLQYCGYA
ncbi:MAG: DUF262 domain-containing protein [Sedimenticola sp.]